MKLALVLFVSMLVGGIVNDAISVYTYKNYGFINFPVQQTRLVCEESK